MATSIASPPSIFKTTSSSATTNAKPPPGFSGNLSLSATHLDSLGGIASLEQIGHVEVNRVVQLVFASNVWLHHNRPGTREPTDQSHRLTIDDGIIIIVPETGPRLPLLSMKAITRSRLKLSIDSERRQVTLKTKGWP